MKIRKQLPLLIFLAVILAAFVAYRYWKTAVTDVLPPKITISEGILEISVSDPKEKLLEGITAYDDRDGDVTSSVLVEKIGFINDNHEISVTYAAFDSSGNVSKTRRTVRYSDYSSPRLYLNRPMLFAYGRDVDIVNCVAAEDVIDGDISHKIKPTVISEIPVSSEGIHQILFRITNSLGDTTELQLPAEVYPTGKYNASLDLTDYLVYIPTGDTFNPKSYLDTFSYSDVYVRLSSNLPEGYRLVTNGTVNTSVPGVYPVSYTLTYTYGTYTYTAYNKIIVIVEG